MYPTLNEIILQSRTIRTSVLLDTLFQGERKLLGQNGDAPRSSDDRPPKVRSSP